MAPYASHLFDKAVAPRHPHDIADAYRTYSDVESGVAAVIALDATGIPFWTDRRLLQLSASPLPHPRCAHYPPGLRHLPHGGFS